MSQPATNSQRVIEGPKDAPLCDASFVYVGLVPGHRTPCVDCLKEIKVVAGGYLAAHRSWPRVGRMTDNPAVVRKCAATLGHCPHCLGGGE